MKRVALALLAVTTLAHAEPRDPQALDERSFRLRVAGETFVAAGGLLLVGTAVRVAIPDRDLPATCDNPCLTHSVVRDMGILAGAATVALGVGIPLLLYARRDHRRALELRATTVGLRF